MLGLKRWLSLKGYGLITSTLFGATTSPLTMRNRFERLGSVSREKIQRKFPGVVFEDHVIEQALIKIESVCAIQSPKSIILFLHGGAFFMGSPNSYRNRAMRLSYRCKSKVFIPDYRLAPEHPYPAALEDALLVWKFIRQLYPDTSILLAGDSAGGGLCLSLLLKLRDLGFEMPNGAILLSPWTDLTVTGMSVEGNRNKDLWFTRKHLEVWATYYANKDDRQTPYVSPAFADFTGLPPLLLLAGEHELLLDDAIRVFDAAKSVGTKVYLHKGIGMQHDWPLTLPWLSESKRAWRVIREFVENAA